MADIAKAYVQVIPSAEGIKSNLESQFSSAGTSGGNAMQKAFKKVVTKAALTTAAVAVTKGITNITKQAVNAYADYEQMVGGIETLFGTGGKSLKEYAESVGTSMGAAATDYIRLQEAQNTVLANANNAYKTAGLSANDYMETVTSFAASLKQSFADTPEGAQQAAAAADQAVVDMADNANKMGTSMEDIQNAYQGFAKQNYTMLDNLKLGYGGTKTEMQRLLADAQELTGVEYDIDNLSDVYAAIHAIQTDLGITGTTAAEAETTITGSMNAMKAAWENLLTAAGSGSGIDTAMQNLMTSAGTFAQNIVPVIVNALTGIVNALPALIPAVTALIPQITSALITNIPALITAGVQLFSGLVQAIPLVVTQLIAAIPQILTAIINGLDQGGQALLTAAADTFEAVYDGAVAAITPIVEAVSSVITSAVEAVKGFVGDMLNAGRDLIQGLINGIKQKLSDALAAIQEVGSQIVERAKSFLKIGSPSRVFYDIGGFVSEGFANGIASGAGIVQDATERMVAGTTKGIGALAGMENSFSSGIAGGGSQINIYTQQLSQSDIDYVISAANRRLGAALA